jgi:hypothetical protein
MSIWQDSYLANLSAESIGQMAIDVNCIFARECLLIQAGQSLYTLPNYVRTLRRVTWRGRTLDAENWEELTMLTPATVTVGNASVFNEESSIGRPLYYAMHPTNPYDIRVYPTPGESFSNAGEPNVYAPQFNTPSCIIDYYREPDTTNVNPVISIPPYVLRRTQKAYVLWKAFAQEGPGQSLKISSYYQMKYNFLIEQFRAINEGCFAGKRYSIEDGMLEINGFRYPRPMLPANFERIIF